MHGFSLQRDSLLKIIKSYGGKISFRYIQYFYFILFSTAVPSHAVTNLDLACVAARFDPHYFVDVFVCFIFVS